MLEANIFLTAAHVWHWGIWQDLVSLFIFKLKARILVGINTQFCVMKLCFSFDLRKKKRYDDDFTKSALQKDLSC